MAASLLMFDVAKRSAQKRSKRRGPTVPREGSGKVLMFTGVRVARPDEAKTAEACRADAEA